MTNDTELVKWAVTPACNMALETINWLENSNLFINLLSQYLLSISQVSASALVQQWTKLNNLCSRDIFILERLSQKKFNIKWINENSRLQNKLNYRK